MTEGEVSDRDAVLITLESGRVLRAWRASSMIRHNRHAAINPYDRASAAQLKAGDAIVVPDRAFIDAARRVLPVHGIGSTSWRVRVCEDEGVSGGEGSIKTKKIKY